MELELKNNQGILFKNEKTKQTQPDFTGEVNVDGKVLRIALWKKQAASGKVYLSVQVSEPREEHKEPKREPKREPQTVGDVLDDAIPFDV